MQGTVIEIQAVYQRYEPDAAGKVKWPVAGKLVAQEGEADGWNTSCGGYEFSAYFVRVNPCDISEPS